MKIAVLMGSPRKKDSYRICKQIEEYINQKVPCKFEYIFLNEYTLLDCKGCDQCFRTSETNCPCKDDIPTIKQKLLEADGIIFACPVYAYHITAPLKRVIDRFAYLFHRQEFVGIPAITVTTTAGSGDKEVAAYLKMTACGWGCTLVDEIRLKSPMYFEQDQSVRFDPQYARQKKSSIQRAAGRLLEALQGNRYPVPTFYQVYMYHGLRSKTFVSKADYAYWKERGWLDQNYFYKTKLGPVKSLYGFILKQVINSMFSTKHTPQN